MRKLTKLVALFIGMATITQVHAKPMLESAEWDMTVSYSGKTYHAPTQFLDAIAMLGQQGDTLYLRYQHNTIAGYIGFSRSNLAKEFNAGCDSVEFLQESFSSSQESTTCAQTAIENFRAVAKKAHAKTGIWEIHGQRYYYEILPNDISSVFEALDRNTVVRIESPILSPSQFKATLKP